MANEIASPPYHCCLLTLRIAFHNTSQSVTFKKKPNHWPKIKKNWPNPAKICNASSISRLQRASMASQQTQKDLLCSGSRLILVNTTRSCSSNKHDSDDYPSTILVVLGGWEGFSHPPKRNNQNWIDPWGGKPPK